LVSGVFPPLALGAIVGGLLAAHVPVLRGVQPISWLYVIGVSLFQTEAWLQKVMQLGMAAHVLESFYTAYLCRSKGFSFQNTWGWCGQTLLVGGFAINDLRYLIKQAEASQSK